MGLISSSQVPLIQFYDLDLCFELHVSFVVILCRVAEEVIFGKENVTTGASNDFMQVSRVARQMVERFGFSKKIGQVAIGGAGGNPFLGQQVPELFDETRYIYIILFPMLVNFQVPSC